MANLPYRSVRTPTGFGGVLEAWRILAGRFNEPLFIANKGQFWSKGAAMSVEGTRRKATSEVISIWSDGGQAPVAPSGIPISWLRCPLVPFVAQ